jgi:hypothetical protein
MIQSTGLKRSIPLGSSLGDRFGKESKNLKSEEKSKVYIEV